MGRAPGPAGRPVTGRRTADEQRRAIRSAVRHGEVTVQQLWLKYFSLGGLAGEVEVEAYLHGLMDLSAGQRDMLAHALNEHLGDHLTQARVPYEHVLAAPGAGAASAPEAMAELLGAVEQVPPEGLVAEVSAAGASMGAAVVLHLVDDEQAHLVPVQPHPTRAGALHAGPALTIEATPAGRAFTQGRTTSSRVGGRLHLWVPVRNGLERLGVLEVVPDGEADLDEALLGQDWRSLGRLVGRLVAVVADHGDALDDLRRRRVRSPAAEVVRGLLPPAAAGTDRCTVAGRLEPGTPGGGDAFDHALSATTAHVAVLHAPGGDPAAGLVAAAALAASRSARRGGGTLTGQTAAVEEAVRQSGGPDPGLTGVFGELDVLSGRFRHLVAAHPAPLLLRDGVVTALGGGDRPPFGPHAPDPGPACVGEVVLQPGDRVLLHTPGVTQARDGAGEPFGLERVSALLRTATAAEPTAETVRRLARAVVEHRGGPPQEDATVVLTRWHPGDGAAPDQPTDADR